jgi:hypothetical protein
MRDNRKGVSVTLHADGIPAVGATKLRLKGTIVVLLGKDEKERAP